MELRELIAIEQAFDRAQIETIAKLARGSRSEAIMANIMILVLEENWSEVLSQCHIYFPIAESSLEKGMILQSAVATTEEIHNMAERETWLKRWNEINDWAHWPWLRYLHSYQNGLTLFFAGENQAAVAHFERALETARGISYSRGEMRTLFHLALISEELGEGKRSLAIFQQAEQLALQDNSLRTLERVRSRIAKASPGERIESLLLSKKHQAARKAILHWERARRSEGRSREHSSLRYSWALLLTAMNRPALAQIALKKIDDPVMREKYFSWKAENGQMLLPFEVDQHRFLRKNLLGETKKLKKNISEPLSSKIHTIVDQDVRMLVQFIANAPEGVTKEEISKELWNHKYDPTIHDGRIYKLVLKARRSLEIKDWVIITYGQYRINPRFILSSF